MLHNTRDTCCMLRKLLAAGCSAIIYARLEYAELDGLGLVGLPGFDGLAA